MLRPRRPCLICYMNFADSEIGERVGTGRGGGGGALLYPRYSKIIGEEEDSGDTAAWEVWEDSEG